MRRHTRTFLASLFVLAIASAAHAADLPWIKSESRAVSEARSSGKPLLIYLHADYCEWCKVMDRSTFPDSRVQLLAKQFVLCKLDGEHEGKPLIKKFDVKSYPFQAFTDPDENVKATALEYHDADKYARVLAANVPDSAIAAMQQSLAANPTDAETAATLATIDAERGDLTSAKQDIAALTALSSPAPSLVTAANHAIALAYIGTSDDDHAAECLKQAIASAEDPREAVSLHLLLAERYSRLHRVTEARAELQIIRDGKSSTRDEKRDAEKRQKALPAG